MLNFLEINIIDPLLYKAYRHQSVDEQAIEIRSKELFFKVGLKLVTLYITT